MVENNIKREIKSNLESTKWVSNVKLVDGNYRGKEKEHKNAYIEFTIDPSRKKSESKLQKLIFSIGDKIKINTPQISIEYVRSDCLNQENHVRRIDINLTGNYKPYEKEDLIKQVSKQFNDLLRDYLPKVKD
jgi:hypothetical protein